MGLLSGKTALITGATRGIGEGIAEKFASEGADIAFTYRSSSERAKALEQQLAEKGVKAQSYQSDAGSFEEAETLVKQILEDFEKVDIVVNNAGITKDNLILRMTEEQWDEVIQINLKSVFNITKNVIKPMIKQKAGSIINISSVVGVSGNGGQSNYAASKAGVIGFSKSIAKELGSRNIRCNVIAPGFIETDMTEKLDDKTRKKYAEDIALKRLGSVEEIANAALFFASDLSSYITGQTLSVCGLLKG